ncbi:unnamed protein product [Camellia sinensis]
MEDSLSKSPKQEEEAEAPGRGGGWGGWGFSPFSVLSDLQKAATVAAQEISRNMRAFEVARTAAKSITDMQNVAEDSEFIKEGDREESAVEGEDEDEDKFDNQHKAALDKLKKASEDSFLWAAGLKVLDSSVENLTSGAWQALGSALRGGSNFVQKLEHSAENLAESIQHGGPVAPSIIESFTNALAGLAKNDIRLSEMSCFAVSQLLMLGKSIISNANIVRDEDLDAHMLNIDSPEDSSERAKIIRTRAQSMTGNVEEVCNSFITGMLLYRGEKRRLRRDSKEKRGGREGREEDDLDLYFFVASV